MTNDFFGERGQAIGKAAREWEAITGRVLTRAVIDDIGYYLDQGIAPDLFIKAYEVTADKGLNWRYTQGILRNCLEDKIYTAHDWEWRLKYKKAIPEIKKQYGVLSEAMECLVLAVTVFREDIESTTADVERYVEAVKSGDTSEWDERWKRAGCTFPSVNSEE